VATLDVTVVVPYTGDPWRTWAHERAIPSAKALGVPVLVGEGATVAEARNNGLDQVDTEWVIHLDADDELPADYIDQMAVGSADVRAPMVAYLRHPNLSRARRREPKRMNVWGHTHMCVGDCLAFGNWLVVGAMVCTDIAQKCRWREWPVYEDYAFWVECWQAGATFEHTDAVYLAHSDRGGRNTSMTPQERHRVHQDIARHYGLAVP